MSDDAKRSKWGAPAVLLTIALLSVGVLLGGAVAAGLGAPWLLDRLSPVEERAAQRAETGADGTRRDASRRRVRRARTSRAESESGTADSGANTPPVLDGDPQSDADDGDDVGDESAAEAALRELAKLVRFGNPPDHLFANDALLASLDIDEATGEAAVAPAGEPPPLWIEEFVAGGADAIDRAVELRGEREPSLDDGVPVALTGRVVDAETGLPIAGAAVVVTSTFYVRELRYDHHLREVARADTDADGEYHIERLNADPVHFGRGGRVYATVTAEGYASARAVALGQVTPKLRNRLADVRLGRGAHMIEGRVLSAWGGEPVAGARVIATGAIDPVAYPKDQRAALFVGAPETTTDADGRFELGGLGAGLHWLSVHGGDDCIGSEPVTLPRSRDVMLRTLPIRGRITGRVIDPEGRPVPLAFVRGGENSTHSFADGHFVLENFVGDRIDLVIAHAAFRRAVHQAVADGTEDLEVALLHRWPEVRLDVRRSDTDAPVAALEVRLVWDDEKRRALPASPFFLAQSGVYSVRLPAGVRSLAITADGLQPAAVDVAGRTVGEIISVLLLPMESTESE